jgi:3-hydroxyisobutyrate dehydrogenase-like beta-hydroxyacid dehydrogenase
MATKNATEVGFIGLGNMGTPMVRRLLTAGCRVTVCDLDGARVQQLVDEGAGSASTPLALAGLAETILTSLPDPAALEAVAFGEDGVISGTRLRRVVDLSTVGPEQARRVACALAERDIGYVDAPVSGGPGGAARGALAIMVGASHDAIAVVQPILEELGRPVVVGGGPGMGQVMKLANNYLAATALAITSEAMIYGVKSGLDPAAMIEAINAGSGRNSASQDKFPRSILTGTFDYGFALGLMCKDLRLFAADADSQGAPIEIGSAINDLWQRRLAELGDGADFTEIIKPLERRTGVQVRAAAAEAAP